MGLIPAGLGYHRAALTGFGTFAVVLIGTAIWALWEVGCELCPLVPRLPVPERHGSYTATWRGPIPGTDATDIVAWLSHHVPGALRVWPDLTPLARPAE